MLTGPIDALVGQRIKQRRQALRMTQSDLAQHIDVRFQQIQKYESGQNRVAASRLYFIAQILQVPVTYFFESDDAKADAVAECGVSTRQNKDVADLVNTLSRRQKKALVVFLRTLATPSGTTKQHEIQ